jgi:pimeloyl-ACP methyl ester carboxylesterase
VRVPEISPRGSIEEKESLPSLADFGWFDEGRGQPILFLHSSGASRRQWARLREPWQDRYRALGLDLWGYGDTSLPVQPANFHLGREVALARSLLTRIDEPFHIVGHSYGGAVGLRLALDFPDQVLSVSVHEPVLFHLLRQEHCIEEWAEISRISGEVLRLIDQQDLSGGARVFVDYWNGDGAWRSLTTDQQERTAIAARKAPLDFAALFGESDPLTRFGDLAGKVLLTVGERTRRPTSKVAALLGSVLGPGSLHIVPGVGHMAPITAPELIRPLLEGRIQQS